MAQTGQSFDLDPKTFTLANMFAMQLHKYKDIIAQVTSSALKELTIETELKKLAELWKEQKFDLHKYNTVSAASNFCPYKHALHAMSTAYINQYTVTIIIH